MYRHRTQLPWNRAAHNAPLRFPLGRPGDPILSMLPPRLETIPVTAVVGSVNRFSQLDRHFRPTARNSFRFRAICKAMSDGVIFPPIELYRLHGAYYVIDGHHRVGAARMVGQLYMEAVVIDCREQNEPWADPLEAARARFAMHTGLQSIAFSTPAGYDQALEQIFEHRWYLSERGDMVSTRDAADEWYRTVYRPVILQVVADRGLRDAYSIEAADLYLHLSDLKYTVSKDLGHDIGFTAAVKEWTAGQGRRRGAFFRQLWHPLLAWFGSDRRQRASS
jgi:hypothetical protein